MGRIDPVNAPETGNPNVGYYPGCALKGSSPEYDMSVRAVSEALGRELREIDDWNCCGASAGHMTDRKLAVCLSLRNLALAERQGMESILAPCPMCSKELLVAADAVATDPEARREAEETIEMSYKGGVRTLNYIQYLTEIGLEALHGKLTTELRGLKVACYYGCLLTRPPKVLRFDDYEQPESFERIVALLGAEPVEFSHKTECCGGGFTQSHSAAVVRLCGRILSSAKSAGADAVAVACPMCHINLDMRQPAAEKELGVELGLPIVYLSQLVGLALGIERKKLGLNRHFISTAGVKGA